METLYHVQVIMSQLKLTKPPWVHVPLALTVYVLVHFLPHHRRNDLDVIVEPASIGSMTNEHETQRPVAFLTYRYLVGHMYLGVGLTVGFVDGLFFRTVVYRVGFNPGLH
uniref:Oligosaccharyltransferase complex subunit n=1 Tax=Castor canadensis TaxID=51338 RepID=A0A8C0XT79_CASCN